jgi:transcriptional regulator with XRE-family HTH domain
MDNRKRESGVHRGGSGPHEDAHVARSTEATGKRQGSVRRDRSGRREDAQVDGALDAKESAIKNGRQLRAARRRRQLTQERLASRVGISRAALSAIECGHGSRTPLEVWYVLGAELGLQFGAVFGHDPTDEPVDAGHLRMQELCLALGKAAGYEGTFELPTRPSDPSRSTDVNLLDRKGRRMIQVECWNSFGNLGAAGRSSTRKLAEAKDLAIALSSHETPLAVGSCWVVRATVRNKALLGRYPHIVNSRFPGSSRDWANALTRGDPFPAEPGFVWCDVGCTRLIPRRNRAAVDESWWPARPAART